MNQKMSAKSLDALKNLLPGISDERKRLERIWEQYMTNISLKAKIVSDGKKDLQCAIKMKTQGNLHYANQNYREALICYNEALCYAPVDSPILGILYANRSAVYLASGLPIQCQENIQLALDYGYPADKHDKLKDRQATCLKMIQQLPTEAIWPEVKTTLTPELSHPAHPKFPFLSKAVGVEIDGDGPKLVARKNLKPGDIFLVDPFHIRVVDYREKENRFARCAFCIWPCHLSLIPCSGCVSFMYCKNCLPKWEKIHKLECKTWYSDPMDPLVFRAVAQTFDLYDGDLDQLKKDIAAVQKTPKLLLEGEYVNALNRQMIKWVFLRWRPLDIDGWIGKGIFASVLLEILLGVNVNFKELVSTREKEITALQVIFSFLCVHAVHNQEKSMSRVTYQPFRSLFFTNDETAFNARYSSCHFEFNICLLPVKRGQTIKIATSTAILEDLPSQDVNRKLIVESMNGNVKPLLACLKARMPLAHKKSKKIEIPDFNAEVEIPKLLEQSKEHNLKALKRYGKILSEIAEHFPCFEVAFVLWIFLMVISDLYTDTEYYMTTGLYPDAKKNKEKEETKKIVARILKK